MLAQKLFIALTITLLFSGLTQPAAVAQELPGGGQATPANAVTVPPGFEIQLLRSAQKGEGSWVSMTFDDHGRLIVGRDKRGIARLTLSEKHDGIDSYEVLEDSLKHCRGVLYAHNSIYVCATDSRGIYRLQDLDGDDKPEDVKLLRSLDYQSRYGHGTNQIVLGPDNMLYIVNGNEVAFPDDTDANSPYRNPQTDQLLPDSRDAVEEVRVGHIVRTDAEGKQWQIVAGGFRNQFDMAFNPAGEMFTYDADMEWDVGQPWYRPTRLNHIVSGGEYGWRAGSGKWPAYYTDSVSTTQDTGLGSPTGMQFGTGSNFPGKYREALFMGDWQNGRILNVHLSPNGATYTCEYEGFLEGGALNVCDLTFGPDGAMYFITGGRGSQSGLYRVTYTGDINAVDRTQTSPQKDKAEAHNAEEHAAAQRKLRRNLEHFHTHRENDAISTIWPHLNSNDRWIRYAARVALENQAPANWRERALNETASAASIAALTALARLANDHDQSALLAAISRTTQKKLNREQQLDATRVLQLILIRHGRPSHADRAALLKQLDSQFPTTSIYLNRELARLMVYLEAPNAMQRLLPLLTNATEQEDAIFYAQLLSRISANGLPKQNDGFVNWITTSRNYIGGRLLPDTLKNIYDDFTANLNATEQARLKPQIEKIVSTEASSEPTKQLPLVQNWKWEDLEPELHKPRQKPSWKKGRAAIAKASCLKCHRLGEQGAFVGPDLTAVGKRFTEQALLESILLPSKVIDEKYRNSTYVLTDGKVHSGHPIAVSAKSITVSTNLLRPDSIVIQRDEIEESFPSKISPMPAGLVDVLTRAEVIELIVYIRSGGTSDASIYQ